MQKRYPTVLWMGSASRRAVALTFDDGPHLRDTPRVLDVLEKHDVHATFHLVGQHAEQQHNLIKQIHGRGHQLALHCYRHLPFPLEKAEVLRSQLRYSRDIIQEVSGSSCIDVRPPYGAFNKRTLANITEWGYRLVMWSCIPPHWMQPVEWSIRQVMEAVIPGAVFVLHDGHGHGMRVAEIVDAVVPRIKSLGYEFVRVGEMQDLRDQVMASK
jgi:peptidoglycan/xylan/chitin deacetylase (PgdA/CDA1 family)